jgi:hypothetical protein
LTRCANRGAGSRSFTSTRRSDRRCERR